MPQGVPVAVPDDGLSTRQRRNRPLLIVHTGAMKGKSTAAFGLALRGWSAGWSHRGVPVRQVARSGKWGRRPRSRRCMSVHQRTGQGGPVEWHKMGEGWSWARKQGSDEDHAAAAAQGWAEITRRLAEQVHDLYVLDEFSYPLHWGWVDTDEVVATLADRPGRQHVVITGRNAPPRLLDAADLVVEMTKVKHPMDAGQKGQRGIEW